MKKTVIIIILCILACPFLQAQKCVNPHFDAQRLDFRDLGYPGATEIPADSSPIVALLSHSNGQVYGATSGKCSHLFRFDPRTNKVFPLGMLPSTKGVHHAILEAPDGKVYIGGGLNETELLTLTRDMPHGRRSIEEQLWKDIKAKYDGFEGGHIFIYDPAEGDSDVYLEGSSAIVKDLGIPVKGNSVYAMTLDAEGKKIYGISYPDAQFFEFDIRSGKSKVLGAWMDKLAYPGPERSWRAVPRGLACGADGRIWSSADGGLMQCWNPATSSFESSMMRVPGEYWEVQNYDAFPVIEQIIPCRDSSFMCSSSDGFIFKVIPAHEKLIVYGKPRVERRVRAMTCGLDNRYYMICGEKDSICRLFSFTETEGFRDFGVLGVDHSPYYAKIAYQFDSMCTGADGSIFIGESDRRAKLFIFIPGCDVFEGVLNPTNPR